jgi:SAM-dependent methyltransferase
LSAHIKGPFVSNEVSMLLANFDKYARDGAYHRRQLDRSWRNSDYHPPLVARYLALVELVPAKALRILEVGCGDGALLYALSWRTQPAVLCGVDMEPDGVVLAHQQLQSDHVRAAIGLASGYDLPYAARSFDVVLLADVIEHLNQPGRALVEIGRVLAPGGVLLASTPHRQPDFVWDEQYHVHEFDGPELRALLTEHFVQVELSGCCPMSWMRRWRRGVVQRQAIRALSRLGYNPLRGLSATPSARFGQIVARCAGPRLVTGQEHCS